MDLWVTANARWFVRLILTLLVSTSVAFADVVKMGESPIPGHPGKTVKWRSGYRKSPKTPKSVHFWFEMELKKPQVGDDVTFVVCAMINVNKTRKCNPATKANLAGGTWTCVANNGPQCPDPANPPPVGHNCDPPQAGNVCWYPNYHFGCKRIRLHAGNNWKDVSSFDKTVTLKVEFTEADMVAPYLDLAVDCPNGFAGCGGVFDQENQFLEPGDGAFPNNANGTSSWWVVTNGKRPTGAIQDGQEGWNTGNWYTMAIPQNTYQCLMQGTVSRAPGGATIEFVFPPSTGAGIVQYAVPGTGCLGGDVQVSIPFVISSSLMSDLDENTYFRFNYPSSLCPSYPSGEVIEFKGEVIALNSTFFPGGGPLYVPGQFMHGIHAQFVADYDPPFIVSQQLVPIDPQSFALSVTGSDATTMAIGATLDYSVNGISQPLVAIPYDDPAAAGADTRFRIVIGPFAPGAEISYQVVLVDDAGNMNTGDLCTNAIPIVGLGPFSFDNSAATTGTQGQTEPACNFFGTMGIANDQWFTWTPTHGGSATLTVCSGLAAGSNNDTKVAIYAGMGCPTAPALACNDDAPCAASGLRSTVSWSTTCGQPYTIQLGRYPGSGPSFGTFSITHSGTGCRTGMAYCFGDGSGNTCPCGNNGAPGNGCANSDNPAGAHLGTSGTASIGFDTLVLTGTGMPTSGTCLYFQGTTAIRAFFGDGLRCVGGTTIRLGIETNVGGASQYPGGGDPSVSVKGMCNPGDVRKYQVWYRNAPPFCTPATFNLTNGMSLNWLP